MTDDIISNINRYINKKDYIFNIIISILVLTIGLLLILSGFNEAFYSESESLQTFFGIITQFGDEMIFIVMFAVMFFGINKVFARRLIIGFLINIFFNGLLKEIFQDPRPPTNFPEGGEPIEEGYGFPSGHSQGAVAFYGYVIYYNKAEPDEMKSNKIIQFISLLLVILLPISRLILGVHDLQDVTFGFVFGIIILTIYLALLPKFEGYKEQPLKKKILIGLAASIPFWLITAILLGTLISWEAAEEVGLAGGLLISGALFFPLEEEYIKMRPEKMDNKSKLISLLVGLVFTMGGYLGLSAAFDVFTTNLWIWRAVRYFILGIIVLIIAPLIIKKITNEKR